MAGERDLQAAAERGAVECRDDRLAQRLERALRGLDARDVVEELLEVVVADLDQVAQVAAGEERVLRRGDDHAGQRVLLRDEPVDGRGKRAAERPVHRVGALVGIVHGQRDDAVVVLGPVDHAHTRSTMVATPMPPPTHSVASPYLRSRRSSSSMSVPRIIAPVAPSGWPSAIAPPLTFTFSCGTSRSRRNFSTTAANAALTSHRSIWSTVSPALASALRAAGPGPVSMIVGSWATTPVATMRVRGVSLMSWPACSLPTIVSAAPSTMPDELPGVCTCSM